MGEAAQSNGSERRPGSRLRRILATSLLTVCYGLAIVITSLLPRVRREFKGTGRILAIGTFHNPNWFLAHIKPLARCGCSEVILIADGYVADVPGVRVIVPNRVFSRIFSRSVAKVVWAFFAAIRYRPDLVMGYAIFPAAVTSLILARLTRRRSCFQLTSGELELKGGGFAAENRVLSSLQTPSPWIEKLAHKVTREFDLIVVRGAEAHDYLREIGYEGTIETITGSVAIPDGRPLLSERDVDVIFVGRVTARKRPRTFVETIELLREDHPDITALIVGDGPDVDEIEAQVRKAGLDEQVHLTGVRNDVDTLLLRSRVFLLTSRWEGLSIAMLEAMAHGTVPVVNDVGDLRDVVDDGVNGHLIADGRADVFAEKVRSALGDPDWWERASSGARATVVDYSSREAVTRKWRNALRHLVTMNDPAD